MRFDSVPCNHRVSSLALPCREFRPLSLGCRGLFVMLPQSAVGQKHRQPPTRWKPPPLPVQYVFQKATGGDNPAKDLGETVSMAAA